MSSLHSSVACSRSCRNLGIIPTTSPPAGHRRARHAAHQAALAAAEHQPRAHPGDRRAELVGGLGVARVGAQAGAAIDADAALRDRAHDNNPFTTALASREIHLARVFLLQRGDHLAHVAHARRAGLGDGRARGLRHRRLVHLLGQELVDDGDLGALLRGKVLAAVLLVDRQQFLAASWPSWSAAPVRRRG